MIRLVIPRIIRQKTFRYDPHRSSAFRDEAVRLRNPEAFLQKLYYRFRNLLEMKRVHIVKE